MQRRKEKAMKKTSKKLLRSICMTVILTMMISCISPLNVDAKKKTQTGIKSAAVYVDNHKYNNKTYVLEKGKSKKLSIIVKPSGKFKTSYKSSKKNFVTISKSGKITGKKIGKSQITIRIKKGKKTKTIKFFVKVIEPSTPVVTPPSKPSEPSQPSTPEKPSEPENTYGDSYDDDNRVIDPLLYESLFVDDVFEVGGTVCCNSNNERGYALLRELDYSRPWMSCNHDWEWQHSECRTTCNYCFKDEGNTSEIYKAHFKSGDKNGTYMHGGYNNGMNDFFVCKKCYACWKHTQNYGDTSTSTAGLNRIYPSFEEAMKNDNPDVTAMMNGYAYKDCPRLY